MGLGAGLAAADAGSASGYLAVTLLAGGLIVGPSAGYAEAGLHRKAAVGIGLRTAGLALASAGVLRGVSSCEHGCSGQLLTTASILGGLGLVFGSTAHDLIRVSADARRAVGARGRGALRVAPSYDVATGAVGVRVGFDVR